MKLASIETITEIRPHPNADRLEIAKVLGWQTVVRKDEFAAGDSVVFVCIDTILPRAPWSEFLVDAKRPDKPIRLRTVKLRGEFSQGLCLPLSVLPEQYRGWHTGADVSGALEIRKFEKELPACLAGIAKGRFPEHLVCRTDEENGLSYPDVVAETLKYPIAIAQKLDGSSCTIIIEEGRIVHVCSRNINLVEDDHNSFWRVAKQIDVAKSPWQHLIIQGELMGPGVQGNQLDLTEPTLFVFQIKCNGAWQSTSEMHCICAVLELNVVRLLVELHDLPPSLEELQAYADEQLLPSGLPAEGIVVRADPIIAQGNGRPLGFKLINRNYKD